MFLDDPWITIAIPSYNRTDLLRRTVQSVQDQSVSGWECVIVDDVSDDGAWEVAQLLAEQDSRVVAYRHDRNIGLAANFRDCGTKGTAPYVLMLAADDQLDRHFLDQIKRAIEAQPDAGLFCARRVQLTSGNRMRPYATPMTGVWQKGTTIARAMANGNLYGLYSSVVIRRQALVDVGGIRDDNPWAGDYEAFVKISARHPVMFIPAATVCQHVDSSTQTTAFLRSGVLVKYEAMTLERLLEDSDVSQYLTNDDVRAGWTRIQALRWAVILYNLSHGQRPETENMRYSAVKSSSRRIIMTLFRLVYQRWRLTY